ncbi:hypothetical protein [Ruminococcus albus]|uniref:Glycosyltransferase RgtA/B/C/D-like domain-containing protein n=1 Tax=Ruminococcus albus TaxID=1264 RepID=A0A1H7PRU1_RUMAL|nr:hypothetical protein [Ruminococcus albus]SEL38329.1 hypothetical protein SAMN05216469_12414 [Ruminococcus albus]
MSENKKRFPVACLFLAVLILIQLVYSTYMFVYKKNGTHSDEIWSYGLANSYYRPFIYLPDGIYQDEYNGGYDGSDITNKWIDGKVMNDYVTVQEGERFTYDSVYHNQVLDHHPPLYYGILHTICSFFPGKFSLWYAYVINIVSMVFIQIFLYKTVKLLTESDKVALVCSMLYGGGVGALSTMLFLRQYGFMTMLITMIWYWNLKMYRSFDKEKGFDLKHNVPFIAVLSFLLFFTNYTTCLVVGIFTGCMCLYMLCKKRIKQMFIYGFSVLGSLCAFIAAYPYVVMHVGLYGEANGSKSYRWGYIQRLKYLLNRVLGDSIGIHFSIFNMGNSAYVFAALVFVLALAVPLCVLFRKEKWFISFKDKAVKKVKGIPGWIRSFDIFVLILLIPNAVYVFILPEISDITRMGGAVSRYIFIVYPVVCLTAVYIVNKLVGAFTDKYTVRIMAVMMAALLVYVNMSSQCPFINKQMKGYRDPATSAEGKNVLLFASETTGNIWYVQCFPAYLRAAKNIFITYSRVETETLNNLGEINTDLIIVPINAFDPEGLWYNRIRDTDSEYFDIIEKNLKESAYCVFDRIGESGENFYIDSFIDDLNNNGSAEVSFCAKIQGEFYAFIEMDN